MSVIKPHVFFEQGHEWMNQECRHPQGRSFEKEIADMVQSWEGRERFYAWLEEFYDQWSSRLDMQCYAASYGPLTSNFLERYMDIQDLHHPIYRCYVDRFQDFNTFAIAAQPNTKHYNPFWTSLNWARGYSDDMNDAYTETYGTCNIYTDRNTQQVPYATPWHIITDYPECLERLLFGLTGEYPAFLPYLGLRSFERHRQYEYILPILERDLPEYLMWYNLIPDDVLVHNILRDVVLKPRPDVTPWLDWFLKRHDTHLWVADSIVHSETNIIL